MPQFKRVSNVPPYPLAWPNGQQRSGGKGGKSNSWGGSFPANMAALERELDRNGINDWMLSANLRPHSTVTANLDDPAAALWFMARQGEVWTLAVLACDRYAKLAKNVKAIELTLQRMRLISEYGVYSIEQIMTGAVYTALPPPSKPAAWSRVLGVKTDATPREIENAYRAKAKAAHPDGGGSEDEFMRLRIARDAALDTQA